MSKLRPDTEVTVSENGHAGSSQTRWTAPAEEYRAATVAQLFCQGPIRVRITAQGHGQTQSRDATEVNGGNACTPVNEFNVLRTSANRHAYAAVLLKLPNNVTCAPPLDATSLGSTLLILSPAHACVVSPSRRRSGFPWKLRRPAPACGAFGFASR